MFCPYNPENQTRTENDTLSAKIIATTWRDLAFKVALIAKPAAALKAERIDVPDGMAVTVFENTDKQFHLVLLPKPAMAPSDEDLEAIAAGLHLLGGMDMPSGSFRDIDPEVVKRPLFECPARSGVRRPRSLISKIFRPSLAGVAQEFPTGR